MKDEAGAVPTAGRRPDAIPGGNAPTCNFFKSGADEKAVKYCAEHIPETETDRIWAALADGGEEGQCGWVRDRFGQYWQVIPTAMTHMLIDPDREAAARAQAAMLKMRKIDIAAMEAAFRGA